MAREVQLTSGPSGRILTNTNVWSGDGTWIVYDTRSDQAGSVFDGSRIEIVNVDTQEVRCLYESRHGAHCGVATWHPTLPIVAFILGPEHPSSDWTYGPARRQGVMVDMRQPHQHINLDARDLVAPFTPGALRGGSHVHIFHPNGQLVSFTYDDHILDTSQDPTAEPNQRNIGVCLLDHPVAVKHTHPRNHSGCGFSVLVSRTVTHPQPGSDEIERAFEEAWVGTIGYRKSSGEWQRYALAFQGTVRTLQNTPCTEVFIVDLPEQLTTQGALPIQGTLVKRPTPPHGTAQRRLTNTTGHRYPGIDGPRHWLRSSPDGTQIGFLKRDEHGIVQFWTVAPSGDEPPRQITNSPVDMASAFTWHPSGDRVAIVVDECVCEIECNTGTIKKLTDRMDVEDCPRPEACVYSPDGRKIAFVRNRKTIGATSNQVCVVESV